MILGWTLCGDGGQRHLLFVGGGVVGFDEAHSALGKHVEAEVAARLDPLVVLFGEDGADEADQRGSVGEDTDDVGAAPWGLFDQIWRQIALGNAVKARMSARAASRCSATAGSLSAIASSSRRTGRGPPRRRAGHRPSATWL